jgi:cytidine deaminase
MIPDHITEQLKQAAKEASQSAYCPYSRFPVGAAVLAGDGSIHRGCNVENASYGLSICAERNAIFQAVAQGERQIRTVVIYTPTSTPTLPCGACRQVIHEFGPDADVFCISNGPDVLHRRLPDLLPEAFPTATRQ